ncbi:hypothetical protein K8R66_02335 [bacterium]|nr:hypothetical protein [bacterium]
MKNFESKNIEVKESEREVLEENKNEEIEILSSTEKEEIKNSEENKLQIVRKELSKEKAEDLNENNDNEKVVAEKEEIINIDGEEFIVRYVPKEKIYPAFGYGGGREAIVRDDLSPRVKKFVKAHELYHCQDKSDFGGWIGGEIRANLIPGMKDPLGLLATIKASLSKDRIKFYLDRFRNKY